MIVKFICENSKEFKNAEHYKYAERFEKVMRAMSASDKVKCVIEKSKGFDKDDKGL